MIAYIYLYIAYRVCNYEFDVSEVKYLNIQNLLCQLTWEVILTLVVFHSRCYDNWSHCTFELFSNCTTATTRVDQYFAANQMCLRDTNTDYT